MLKTSGIRGVDIVNAITNSEVLKDNVGKIIDIRGMAYDENENCAYLFGTDGKIFGSVSDVVGKSVKAVIADEQDFKFPIQVTIKTGRSKAGRDFIYLSL